MPKENQFEATSKTHCTKIEATFDIDFEIAQGRKNREKFALREGRGRRGRGGTPLSAQS